MQIKKSVVVFLVISSALTYSLLLAHSPIQQVNVKLLWHDKTVNCQSLLNPENQGEAWFLKRLQFFLSGIEVEVADQGWQRLKLIENPYQTAETVLLGTHCLAQKKQKNAEAEKVGRWLIEFDNNIKLSKIHALRFTLGVPFESNHLNPISQKSPLNLPSMFWVWQTGHKFMRAEFASTNAQWLFHLGSTGCKAHSAMRAPKKACRYPHTFEFEVPIAKGNSNAITLNLNLAELLKHVELAQASSCQSERGNKSCQQLLKNLSVKKMTDGINSSGVFSVTKIGNSIEKMD